MYFPAINEKKSEQTIYLCTSDRCRTDGIATIALRPKAFSIAKYGGRTLGWERPETTPSLRHAGLTMAASSATTQVFGEHARVVKPNGSPDNPMFFWMMFWMIVYHPKFKQHHLWRHGYARGNGRLPMDPMDPTATFGSSLIRGLFLMLLARYAYLAPSATHWRDGCVSSHQAPPKAKAVRSPKAGSEDQDKRVLKGKLKYECMYGKTMA